MRFEPQYCVPVSCLNEDTFNSLVDHLVLEGYHIPTLYIEDLTNWKDFAWVGVNNNYDIVLYSESPWYYHASTSYGKEHEGRYPYIYSCIWLNKYLNARKYEILNEQYDEKGVMI